MKTVIIATVVATFILSGCAGVNIKPISRDQAVNAHTEGSTASGYIVYEPIVVVEISQKDVCVDKDDKGNCKSQETRCSAGAPFVLPDYSKPYLVDAKSGFGKSGVEITITDGWRLGNIKDNSDNTAVLGTVEKLIGLKSALITESAKSNNCQAPGLYRVTVDEKGVALSPMLVY